MTGPRTLEERVALLEAQNDILRLKARYAQLCDAKYLHGRLRGQVELDRVARELADLFTADAVWDGAERFGVSRGREAIFERFRGGTFAYALHYFTLPELVVEPARARARWYLLEAATLNDGTAVWIGGHEDDDYALEDGRWLISGMRVDLQFISPVEQGWAKRNLLV